MKIFDYWGWDDAWAAVLVAAAISFLGLGLFALTRDHSVKFYYPSNYGKVQCISGHRDWASDDVAVFCSDDVAKALSVMKQMNDALVAAKPK